MCTRLFCVTATHSSQRERERERDVYDACVRVLDVLCLYEFVLSTVCECGIINYIKELPAHILRLMLLHLLALHQLIC